MKLMVIFGTRPEGIKIAPIIKAVESEEEIELIVVNTGQHREMLNQVLDLFSIKPNYNLDVMRENQTPEEITAKIITRVSKILDIEKPDLVLVHGDTTTTFAGAYASFLKKIPIGHVEAGLRTYEMYSPFPEEMNRQLVGKLATFHFAATEKNKGNLLKENIDEENIAVVGNTVIDALISVSQGEHEIPNDIKKFLEKEKKTILVTTHRRENIGDLKNVYEALNYILNENEDVQVVFPIHKNPLVRKEVRDFLNSDDRVLLTEPLDYEVFAYVMGKCHFIITDSGGIQEEAPALGKPVLVARKETERQEGVEAGTLKLVGLSKEAIIKESERLLNDEGYYNEISKIKNPYGDGKTSKRIIEFVKGKFRKKRG